MAEPSVKLDLVELRLKRAFKLSKASAESKKTLVARFGHGIGEGSSSIHYGLSSEAACEILRELLRTIEYDWNADTLAEFVKTLPASINVARCALEMALLDYRAKEANLPLWKFLDLPMPEPTPSAYTITYSDEDDITRQLESATEFEILKLKVGFPEELKFVDFVLRNNEKRFILDANGGWTRESAVERIKSLSGYPVVLIEQPTAEPDLKDLDFIKGKVECTLFLDESIRNGDDIDKLHQVIDGVSLKLSKCGGISSVIAMASRAREYGLQLLLGCMLESAIGITAALHLASLFDFHDLDSILLTENDPFWGAHFEGQNVILPGGPGIGIKTQETTFA